MCETYGAYSSHSGVLGHVFFSLRVCCTILMARVLRGVMSVAAVVLLIAAVVLSISADAPIMAQVLSTVGMRSVTADAALVGVLFRIECAYLHIRQGCAVLEKYSWWRVVLPRRVGLRAYTIHVVHVCPLWLSWVSVFMRHTWHTLGAVCDSFTKCQQIKYKPLVILLLVYLS